MKNEVDKSESIRVRLSAQEKEALLVFCKKFDVKYSVAVRRVLRAMISHGPSFFQDEQKEIKRLRIEVARIGVNLNQIARGVNSGRVKSDPVSAAQIDELKVTIDGLRDLMKTMLDNSKSRRVTLRKIARKDVI